MVSAKKGGEKKGQKKENRESWGVIQDNIWTEIKGSEGGGHEWRVLQKVGTANNTNSLSIWHAGVKVNMAKKKMNEGEEVRETADSQSVLQTIEKTLFSVGRLRREPWSRSLWLLLTTDCRGSRV